MCRLQTLERKINLISNLLEKIQQEARRLQIDQSNNDSVNASFGRKSSNTIKGNQSNITITGKLAYHSTKTSMTELANRPSKIS
jgi:hypothetical protein